jgi:hypothetical protein
MRLLLSRFVSLCINIGIVSAAIDLEHFQEFDEHSEIVFVLIADDPLDVHASSVKITEQQNQLMHEFIQ